MKIYWKIREDNCHDNELKYYPTVATKSTLAEDGEMPTYFIQFYLAYEDDGFTPKLIYFFKKKK